MYNECYWLRQLAKLSKKEALHIGIATDKRRHNKSVDAMQVSYSLINVTLTRNCNILEIASSIGEYGRYLIHLHL